MQLHISDEPPTSRAFLIAASLDVGDILKSYIAIHNDFFKVSLRRILPLPVFFRSINFEDYFRRLFYLNETLAGIVRQFPDQSDESPELLSVIKSYCAALTAAIAELREICGSMMEKAAHRKTYSWAAYQSDLKKYNAAVSRYRMIGSELNMLLKG